MNKELTVLHKSKHDIGKWNMCKKSCFLFILLSPLLGITSSLAEPNNLQVENALITQNPMITEYTAGPWNMRCEIQKFPSKARAKQYLNGQQIDLQYCQANQSLHRFLDHRNLMVTLKITPARILIETHNIRDHKKNPQLIIGESSKWFTLYENCYQQENDWLCLFLPEDKKANDDIIQAMQTNSLLIFQIFDDQTNQYLHFDFSLEDFDTINFPIQNVYQTMATVLQPYIQSNDVYALADEELWKNYYIE
jgi:hypothetical protein